MAFPTGWTYRQPITVDNTTTNGGGVFALSSFQVQLTLNSGNFTFAHASANGSDLVITSDLAGSTVLNFWIAAYNSGAQTGTIYVLVSSLAIGATMTIYLWYGQVSQTASLGSYASTMTKLATGSGVANLYHCDDASGSSLAEAGGGTAATVVNGAPTWEPVDGGLGLNAIQYLMVTNPVFSTTGGGWSLFVGAGTYSAEQYFVAAGSGANTATWSLTGLAPGTYNVSLTWSASGNRATNTPVTVSDGSTLLNTVSLNQQSAPSGITDAFGTTWTVLNATALISSGTLNVKMTDNANGFVIAGTIRVAPTLCNAPFAAGSAVTLNGSTQCITIPGFKSVSMPQDGAIMFWFRPKSTALPSGSATVGLLSFFGNFTNGSAGQIGNAVYIYINNLGEILLNSSVGGVTVLTASPVLTVPWQCNWNHFAYVWSLAQREVWLNGQLLIVQSTNGNGNVGLFAGQSAVNDMTIGAVYNHDAAQTYTTYPVSATPYDNFSGTIDEIVVLNHQPLPEEILSAYTRRTPATGMFQDGRWTKSSTLVSPPAWSGASSAGAIEPTVFYLSSGSQVMALSARTSGGANSLGILTATDGGLGTWSDPGGNPIVASGHGSQFLLDGSTYYWFYTDSTTVYYRTSSTGLYNSWSGATSTGITVSSISQSWASSSLWGVCVFRDPNDNTWKSLQEGYNGTQYNIGLLTSGTSTLAGATFTAYASNPLTTLAPRAAGGFSHPDIQCNVLGSGIYSLWYHGSLIGFGPSIIYYSTSTDLHTWTTPKIVLRLGDENFAGTAADQTADPRIVYGGTTLRMYYDTDAGVTTHGQIYAATYANTLANLLVDPPAISFGAEGPPTIPSTGAQWWIYRDA